MKQKVHNLEANSIELRMKQMVSITPDDGLGIVYECEAVEVPNKRKKKKSLEGVGGPSTLV